MREDAVIRKNLQQAKKNCRAGISLLQQQEIPETWPEEISVIPLNLREELIAYCGYCLLSYDWLSPLARWIGNRSCLEIMCGSGALSKGLQNCGVTIRATDDQSWKKEHATSWFQNSWIDIEPLDAFTAIERYGRTTELILCSWPYPGETCYQVLQKIREINNAALFLYIGEWQGGGTASDSFFESAIQVHDDAFLTAVRAFKSVYGTTDRPYLIR